MYGARLRALRKQKNKTIEQCAASVGVATSTYAGYESEHRQPPLETFEKMAVFLGTSTDYLLGLTDNPVAKEDEWNAKKLLGSGVLHWDGMPLTEEELEPIRKLLEMVVRERLPKFLEDNKKQNGSV